MSLVDLKSANGTAVNGRVLANGVPTPLRVGDRVKLGSLEVELVDAARLFDVLMTETTRA